MMTLLIVAAILIAASASAAPVDGGDPCRRGPIYWCSSVQKAASCSAFTHCLQTVWEPQLIRVQQTKACLSSQEMVENARRERTVDGKIHDPLVSSLCKPAEDEETKEWCQETVTKFLPQVLSLLDSRMEASSLSALLGLCRLYDDEPAVVSQNSDINHAPYVCQDCHNFLRDAKKLLEMPGAQNEVITILENYVCSEFSDLQIWCKTVVDVSVPKLLKFIMENKGAEMLCGFTSVCEETEGRKLKDHYWSDIIEHVFSSVKVDTDSEVICHDCDKVLTYLLAFDKDSPIRTSFEQAIAHLCSFTSLTEEACRLLSEGFSRVPEELLHSASSNVDVPYVCHSMVGCTGEKLEHSDLTHKVQVPAENMPAPVVSPVSVSENHIPNAALCSECERVLEDVQQALQTERFVVQMTMQAKQTVCRQMGGLEEQCHTMVDVFAPVLVDWLNKDKGPRFVCSQLKVCPSPIDMKSLDLVKIFGNIWHEDSLLEVASVECDVCYSLMKELAAADRNQDLQEAIVDFFSSLCDQLGQEASQCNALVSQYTPYLFEILANELDLTTVCELLISCTKPRQLMMEAEEPVPEIRPEEVLIGQQPTANEEHRSIVKKAKKAQEHQSKSLECSVCLLAMESIDRKIGANTTEEKLHQLLDKVCSLLPAEDKKPCEQLMDTFAPAIIHLLLQHLDPLMICAELELCQNGSQLRLPIDEKKNHMEEEMAERKEEAKELSRETIQCELCELVVGTLDRILAENRTEAALRKALDEVCGVIPEKHQSQCLSLLDQYSSVLVELLLQKLQPQQVCIFVKLCKEENVGKSKNVVYIALPEMHNTPAPMNITGDPNSSHNKKQMDSTSMPEVCLVCQTLDNYLKEALNEETTQDKLEKLLRDVCTTLQDNLKGTCNRIAEQFTPLILQLLLDKTDPKEVCETLKLCSPETYKGRMQISATEKKEEKNMEGQMVGTDVCTYGPSYWCASVENARKCGMEQECVEKYGMKP